MAHILVVDDAKNIRRMVSMALRREGHVVEDVEDASEALERFGDGSSWDLLLTDQRMPGMDGSELTVEARRRSPAARILMMTAFVTTELAAFVLQSGASDFLRKPFSTDDLRSAVRGVLERPAVPRPAARASKFAADSMTYSIADFDFAPAGWGLADKLPPGVEIARAFTVRPNGGSGFRCVVGVTPHVAAQIRRRGRNHFPVNHFIWDYICERRMADYLYSHRELPPDLLPVIDVESDWLYDIRRLGAEEEG